MAQPVTFKQAEAMPLGAGPGNPNTNNMPYGLATNPTMLGEEHKNIHFFVSKWRFSEEEKKDFRERVHKKLIANNWHSIRGESSDEKVLLDLIVSEFDHVWLALMHTPVPALILTQDPYETAGYIEVNPKDN